MATSRTRRPAGDLFHLGRYFTPSRIQTLWYAYLAIWAWQFLTTAYASLNSMYLMGSFETVSVLFLIGDLLWRIVYMLLARLFFEVAQVYLSKN